MRRAFQAFLGLGCYFVVVAVVVENIQVAAGLAVAGFPWIRWYRLVLLQSVRRLFELNVGMEMEMRRLWFVLWAILAILFFDEFDRRKLNGGWKMRNWQ